uniref:Uncharacterized protein n=1 Tax=Favella ehrenbergii TaxID=182087 RepID=A0A7S3HWJ3_9SPIT
MLAVVTIVVLTPLVVVHSNQLSFHGIIEVLPFDEHVRAQDNLVLPWQVRALHEAITRFEPDVQGGLQREVTCQQTVRHRRKKLLALESIEVSLDFKLGPSRVLIKQLFAMGEEGRIEAHVRCQE